MKEEVFNLMDEKEGLNETYYLYLKLCTSNFN